MVFLSSCANHMGNPSEDQESPSSTYENVRSAAVAGQFYSGDSKELRDMISGYLAGAGAYTGILSPRALLSPHAGYVYSGAVAAYSYAALTGLPVKTVVLIGNSHSDYFSGIAVDDRGAWKTPLGKVPVDQELADRLVNFDRIISYNSEVHNFDHTLEVQLPFLQSVLPQGFRIVPVVFGNTGDNAYLKLADALDEFLGEGDIIVVSSDLSHYPSYDDANTVDRQTLEVMAALDTEKFDIYQKKAIQQRVPNEQTLCCGVDGIKTVMALAAKRHWRSELLKYANSGDTPDGDKNRVVGYGAMVFGPEGKNIENPAVENAEQGLLAGPERTELLMIARQTVEAAAKSEKIPDFTIDGERLNRQGGVFVTLHMNGKLRGCIGQIIPSGEPLWQVVRNMAAAAAMEDPRFSPVSENELDAIKYEISVLSVPEALGDWRKIELGRHGVIVRKGAQSGVFLPQVATETGWNREELLAHLCQDKAGLPADSYKSDPDTRLEIFTAQVFD